MNSKKRMLILLCIVFAVNLMVIGTIFQLFYSTAASITESQGNSNEIDEPITTAEVLDADANLKAEPEISLYYIYLSSKWSRMKGNVHADYLATQDNVLNTKGSIVTKYTSSQSGITSVDTTLKTGPGGSYSSVVELPLGKTLDLIGEITNPTGEKWLMYKYAYATYFVVASDIEIIAPPPTPTTPTTASKSTTTSKSTTQTTPSTVTMPPPAATPSTENAQKIVNLAYSKLGSAYVYGATGPTSFDCSGFVYWVVNNSGIPGLSVPRTSIALFDKFASYNIGTSVANAKPGDIILFSKDGTRGGISHSAIYYKDSKMIHASEPSTGVILTTVAYSTSNKSVFAIIRLPGV